jgi:hypothetical protein
VRDAGTPAGQGGDKVATLSKPLAFVAFWTVVTAVATVLTTVVLFRFHVGVPGGILAALGQMLVLSAVVSWRWWWVLASLGSAVISTILVPLFWNADGYSQVVISSVAVLASLPQWLVLRRYGLRSFLWFAVPVLTALTTVLVYQLQGDLDFTRLYIDEGADVARWLPTVTIIGAVAGLFQGIALTWILAPEFDRTGPVERSAPLLRPPVAPAVTVSRVAAVRTFLLVLTALVVPIFMPKMFIETWGLPDREIVPYTLAAAAPWVVALALLRPGLYHAGLRLRRRRRSSPRSG